MKATRMLTVFGTVVAVIGFAAVRALAAGETELIVIAVPEPGSLALWPTVLAAGIVAARWFHRR